MSPPTAPPPRRPAARRRPTDPPAEARRPVRSVGYRVPVILDDEFDGAPDPARPPMWEQWDEPAPGPAGAEPIAAAAVPRPLPDVETWPESEPARVQPVHEALDVAAGPPRSLYLSALRVRHLQLGVFERVLLVEGVLALAVVLALADLASPWLIAVLPVVVAALVKLHDLVQEGIERARGADAGPVTRNGPGGSPGLG